MKCAQENGTNDSILVFDDGNGRIIDLDLRGDADDVIARLRLPQQSKPGRYRRASAQGQANDARSTGAGRPKLGVVSREVTLLPRQWEWLAAQPGGASVTLRRLVDDARRTGDPAMEARARREAAYHFLHAVAGDYTGYEDATRKLFADDVDGFRNQMADWPRDIRDYALALALGTGGTNP